ncbi:MAG: MotA/TolQ/ExbB proton channel family protein [Myxococcota bacterium]|nr:MotA/TolQ/ExbB proton channel family protein [Myxococcota bacterium]
MLTELLGRLFERAGAEWVLWFLLFLSVLSVTIIVQRALFHRRNKVDATALTMRVTEGLSQKGIAGLSSLSADVAGMLGAVLKVAASSAPQGPDAVEESIQGTIAVERIRYDRFLSVLGSIASNAPFIGLLGTVIGVLNAFGQLAGALEGISRAELVMGSISEALVATAAGLAVAIPAVIAFNMFKRKTAVAVAESRAITGLVLAHMRGTESGEES